MVEENVQEGKDGEEATNRLNMVKQVEQAQHGGQLWRLKNGEWERGYYRLSRRRKALVCTTKGFLGRIRHSLGTFILA